MLRDNSQISLVTLSDEDFRTVANQFLYRAIRDLHQTGKPADLVTVADLLKDRDHIKDVPYPYLGRLWDAAPVPQNAAHYARIVSANAARRKLLSVGDEILAISRSAGPVHELITEIKGLVSRLEHQPGTPSGIRPSFSEPILASQLSTGSGPADWVWRGYLARGSVTLLTSLWKAGKSTLLAHLVKAMGQGDELAGLPVAAGKVLIVSEESAALWASRRDKIDIGDHALF